MSVKNILILEKVEAQILIKLRHVSGKKLG